MEVGLAGWAWNSGVARASWCTYVVLRSMALACGRARLNGGERLPYSREISKCEDAQQTGLATGTVANDDQLSVGADKETTSVRSRDDSKS